MDLDGQANNLNQISDIISFSNLKNQIAHGGEDGTPGDKQLLQKTVFLRTIRILETGDFQLLYFLNLFGVRYILNDEFQYGLIMCDRLRR